MSAEVILIVGGYGHVGGVIARRLVAHGGARVRIAGRSLEKARKAAAAIGCEAAPLDLGQPRSWEGPVEEVGIVVVCMDQPDNAFARHVLALGKAYVDITASYAFMEAVERLDGLARSAGGRAVLSVGLAPGLTNLLVRACVDRLDLAEVARIGILLGLGDVHGRAAIAWVLSNADEGRASQLQPELFRFANTQEVVPAYPFPFADQYVVRRTLSLGAAATFLTLECRYLAGLAFRAARLLKGRRWIQDTLANILARIRVGSDRVALSVDVTGLRGGRAARVSATCEGRGEADITAFVAVLVVQQLLRSDVSAGIYHIEQVLQPEAVFDELRAQGLTIEVA